MSVHACMYMCKCVYNVCMQQSDWSDSKQFERRLSLFRYVTLDKLSTDCDCLRVLIDGIHVRIYILAKL